MSILWKGELIKCSIIIPFIYNKQEREQLEQHRAEEARQHEQERREEEACMESEHQATKEWQCLQVHVEAVWRWVVVEELVVNISEFQELAGTLEVTQEAGLSCDKGKGPELALESMGGQEL